ncbi:hypothetical protein KIPB_014995, partial [Kipferlia bialata]|eukprot:g14995.t1
MKGKTRDGEVSSKAGLLQTVQAVDSTAVSVLVSCERVGVDVLLERAVSWSSTGPKGTFHLVTDGSALSVVLIRPDGCHFTCTLDPNK